MSSATEQHAGQQLFASKNEHSGRFRVTESKDDRLGWQHEGLQCERARYADRHGKQLLF